MTTPPDISALLTALRSPDYRTRQQAAQALGTLNHPAVIAGLQQALYELNWQIYDHAINALVQIGSPAIPALLETLKHPDIGLRRRASRALGQIGDPAAAPALLAALNDPDDWVRRYAIESLGLVGDLAAIPALLRALGGPDGWTRRNAAAALGQLGDPVAVPELAARLADTEKPWWSKARICDVAAEALEQIGTPEALAALEQWREEQGGS